MGYPRPSPGLPILLQDHTMTDYRRNRAPGGTYFFTVNLLDAKATCWSATSRRCARWCGNGVRGLDSISMLGGVAGSYALHVDVAAG